MQHQCIACHTQFEILEKELDLLQRISPSAGGERFSIPPPHHCPPCREQRRMAWRNERNLFSRESDKSGRKLVSMFPPGTPFPVWSNVEWWGDENDATTFGRDLDRSKTIFTQMAELRKRVPRLHTFNYADDRQVNSDFTNCAGDIKDCYLIFGCLRDEKCMYSAYTNDSYFCADCFFTFKSTNCYECTDIQSCNSVFFSTECSECSESYFLFDCRGCDNCVGCYGLRQKRFHIFNQPYSKEDYYDRLAELGIPQGKRISREGLETIRSQFTSMLRRAPRRPVHGEQNENSTGDYLWYTKDCVSCFDMRHGRDCMYCTWYVEGKDSADVYAWGETELCYQVSGGGDQMYQCAFTAKSFGCKESYYLDLCVYVKNCFACVGLKHKQYCILNKQYTKDEYERLLPEVIRHMQQCGEWGQYLPEKDSPWGYNYSIAAEYYPLTRDEAERSGFRWDEYQAPQPTPKLVYDTAELRAATADERYLEGAVRCEESGKFFRYTKLEIEFYQKNNLPLPLLHPDARHRARLATRNPRRIWKRFCEQCGKELLTSHNPTKPSLVYCEECYLKEIYA